MEMSNYSKVYASEKYPLKKDTDTYFSLSFGNQAIKISILTILMTHLGERVFMPTFGSRIHELVFQRNDKVFDVLLEDYVIDALNTWEPRISIQSVAITHQRNENKVYVRLSFSINKPGEPTSTFSFGVDRSSGNVDTLEKISI